MKMLILDILIKDIRNSNKGYNTNDLYTCTNDLYICINDLYICINDVPKIGNLI